MKLTREEQADAVEVFEELDHANHAPRTTIRFLARHEDIAVKPEFQQECSATVEAMAKVVDRMGIIGVTPDRDALGLLAEAVARALVRIDQGE